MADIEKLKALANEAIADQCWEPLLGLTGAETEFAKAASPDAVLELIAEVERLRDSLTETTAVAITMLYDSHRQDTLKEFTVPELDAVVDASRHLSDSNVQVEAVYRKAWDLAMGGNAHG